MSLPLCPRWRNKIYLFIYLFSLKCNRSPFPFLEHLITLLLPTFGKSALSTHFIRILYQTHSPVYTTAPLNQPLVLYHLKITVGLSQTCHLYTQQFQPFPHAHLHSPIGCNKIKLNTDSVSCGISRKLITWIKAIY